MLAPPVERLIAELSRLPGIGQRTAQRLAFHILRADAEQAGALAAAIGEVRERIGFCHICFNLAEKPADGSPLVCPVCADARRDTAEICVVEEFGDVLPIERTHEFRGRYHVLGGALSPIDGVDPEDLRLDELYARVTGSDGVREVVIATNPTTTGEATALHIARVLGERAPDVVVTRLASGLPVGGDLEYADELTLGRAFLGRRTIS
ncbi:MAG: recombination mediator RecR [Baekduia sp.]